MKSYIISKSKLETWVDNLIKQNEVLAPVKQENFTNFYPVHSAMEIVWGPPQTIIPPKRLLYPQSEELLAYEFGEAGPQLKGVNVKKSASSLEFTLAT